MLGGFGGHLLGEHALEEIDVGQLLGGRFLQKRFQTLAALEQAQPLQMFSQTLQLGRRHWAASSVAKWPPSCS